MKELSANSPDILRLPPTSPAMLVYSSSTDTQKHSVIFLHYLFEVLGLQSIPAQGEPIDMTLLEITENKSDVERKLEQTRHQVDFNKLGEFFTFWNKKYIGLIESNGALPTLHVLHGKFDKVHKVDPSRVKTLNCLININNVVVMMIYKTIKKNNRRSHQGHNDQVDVLKSLFSYMIRQYAEKWCPDRFVDELK
jgi:hypothetical protein